MAHMVCKPSAGLDEPEDSGGSFSTLDRIDVIGPGFSRALRFDTSGHLRALLEGSSMELHLLADAAFRPGPYMHCISLQ